MITHGLTRINGERNPLYGRWKAMHYRCYDPKNTQYPNYGGRGIRVCKRWHDFTKFSEDMGQPPEGKKHEWSLDRIENDGNYKPGNCRWATWTEQNNNRRHPKRKKRPLTELVYAEAIKLFKQGFSTRAVAKKVGCGKGTAWKISRGFTA